MGHFRTIQKLRSTANAEPGATTAGSCATAESCATAGSCATAEHGATIATPPPNYNTWKAYLEHQRRDVVLGKIGRQYVSMLKM